MHDWDLYDEHKYLNTEKRRAFFNAITPALTEDSQNGTGLKRVCQMGCLNG